MTIDKTKIIMKILSLVNYCIIGFFLIKYNDVIHNSMERTLFFITGVGNCAIGLIPLLKLIFAYLDGDHEDDGRTDTGGD